MSELLRLHAWFHPRIGFPRSITFDTKELEFCLPRTATVDTLMEACEDRVFEKLASILPDEELVISVLWNPKNPKKALDPRDILALHFLQDDNFGVHGELMPLPEVPIVLPEESKIPIIVLTGFLGAGKTTLLNYILQEQQEKKIAVIENEFGAVAIDNDLLKDQSKISLAENVVVMGNGCMCCTVREDLEYGLKSIMQATKTTGPIDALIIETTGMADPVPIVRTIKSVPDVMNYFRLDGVIAVADAKHLPARLTDNIEAGKVNEAYQQIAFADRVLLNKIDLVTPEQVMDLQQSIRKINHLAKMVPSVRGQVNLTDIIGLNAHSLMHFKDDDFSKIDDTMPAPAAKKERKGAMSLMSEAFSGKSLKKSRHSSRVGSFSLVQEGEISPDLFGRYLHMLQSPPPSKGQVFRFKAILAVKDRPEKIAVHAVMDVVDHDSIGMWEDGEPRICKMVFIGKDLDEAFFRTMFNNVTKVSL